MSLYDDSLNDRRTRLLWRIHQRFVTATDTLRIGEMSLAFTRVADPDRVLDEVAAEADRREKLTGRREQDPQHLPYWAELWDSAAGIGQLVERVGLIPPLAASHRGHLVGPDPSSPRLARRPTVLDLGCGMGLAGTVAAALGAEVVFADLESPALLFAQLNSLPYRRRIATRRLNWQRDDLKRKFDLILGSDILYERKQWEYLEPFWRAHLQDGGAVLLGEPGRQTGDLFLPWITGRSWELAQFAEVVPTRPTPIRIFRISRAKKNTDRPPGPCESV